MTNHFIFYHLLNETLHYMSCIFCFFNQQSVDTDCVSIPELLLDHNCWFLQLVLRSLNRLQIGRSSVVILSYERILQLLVSLILQSIKFQCLVSIVQLLFIIWIWIGSASKRLHLVALSMCDSSLSNEVSFIW